VNLRTYPRVLSRRKWWVVGCVLIGLLGATVYAFAAHEQYSATTQLLLEAPTASATTPTTNATIQVATELQLLTSPAIVNAVEARLGLSSLDVSVGDQGGTNAISVTANASTADQAARIANAYATEFVDYENSLALKNITRAEDQLQQQINAAEKQLPSTSGSPQGTALANQLAALQGQYSQLQVQAAGNPGGVTVFSSATTPTAPSSPKTVELILIGLAVGLLVGICAAFIVDSLDDSIRSKEQLEELMPGVPIFGLIPQIKAWRRRSTPYLATQAEPQSPVAEAYWALRTSLKFVGVGGRAQSVLVTSPASDEGKTSTAANIGVVLSKAGQRVVLVSVDFRRPRLSSFFGTSDTIGLTSVVVGDSTLEDALQEVPDLPGLTYLGTGPAPPDPAGFLSNPKTAEIFDALRRRFDVVVYDTPPVVPVTDAVLMAKQTDVSLVVVATGITSRASLRRTQEQLTRAGVEQLGIVLNDVSREIREVAPAYGYAPNSPKREVDYRKREVSSAKRVRANGSSANGSSDNGTSDNGSSDMTENQVDSVTASSMTNRYED
ncbi:MAG TPA: polysaccharide biosynthesis tyrosine autokinase, partial [Acidimicrobiales bacterium]|nr:polysaccharide biosynthesis tyrosine autokinase [Acidimicrobiales bacterium]